MPCYYNQCGDWCNGVCNPLPRDPRYHKPEPKVARAATEIPGPRRKCPQCETEDAMDGYMHCAICWDT